jgi:hypothetical protein
VSLHVFPTVVNDFLISAFDCGVVKVDISLKEFFFFYFAKNGPANGPETGNLQDV